MSTVMLSVGDASGDVYAGDFVQELRALRPDTRFLGMGGAAMQRAGVELVADQRELAASGLFELIPDLHRIIRTWRRMIGALRVHRPDLVVLVDSSGFNIPFARRAHRRGIPTLYYVSPQVWGWRTGRIQKLARCVDRLAVIFPFEVSVYAETSLPVEFVGHPLVERLRDCALKLDRATARQQLGLGTAKRIVALLPGSRRSEMRHTLPLQLAAARALHARDPEIGFVLPRAPSLDAEMLESRIARARLPEGLALQVLSGRAHEVLRAADVALVKPGTATLEATLLGCPMVVAARVSRITAAIVRRLVRVETLAMPNLIAGRAVVPELLQEQAQPERVADALETTLAEPARSVQLERLDEVCRALSQGGAARRAASIAAEMIGARLPG